MNWDHFGCFLQTLRGFRRFLVVFPKILLLWRFCDHFGSFPQTFNILEIFGPFWYFSPNFPVTPGVTHVTCRVSCDEICAMTQISVQLALKWLQSRKGLVCGGGFTGCFFAALRISLKMAPNKATRRTCENGFAGKAVFAAKH
jgi:hypothetical protein